MRKVAMAVSGIMIFGFVIMHMAGNLKVFQGPEKFNHYAEFIREVGSPLIPNGGVLWAFRIGLLVAFIVHVGAAFSLWRMSSAARPVGYHTNRSLSFSYASGTMRWGGVILLLFVIYHILHFTTGQAHVDFIAGDVYHNFVTAFQSPLVVGAYAVAQCALCLHLYHGLWSATQTVGGGNSRSVDRRRWIAGGLAGLVFVGFLTPPFAVVLGFLG